LQMEDGLRAIRRFPASSATRVDIKWVRGHGRNL
jgi:hypothetical protein